MLNTIDFEIKEGSRSDRKLNLLALTTCGFCKKAKAFLDENDFRYEFTYMDKIDPLAKKEFKAAFSERYGKRLTYPTLMIDDNEILTGFIRIAWEKELLD